MPTLDVLVLVGLLLLTAFLATARSALVNVRKARLRQLMDEGVRGAGTAYRLAEDATRLLSTAQLGSILTSFFAGALVAVKAVPPLALALKPWLQGAGEPVALVLVVLLAAIVMLILGTLVPETVAAQHAEKLSLWLARPLAVIAAIAMPLVRSTVWLSNGLSRLLGASSSGGMPYVTEEQIKTLVDAGEEEGVIEEEEKDMIFSIFELGDTLARQVMVPRIDVMALDVATPMLEALETIMSAQHSRIPMYEETIDNVVGVLHVKDLLPFLQDGRTDVPLKSIVRPAYFIPETKRAGDLLPDLQKRHVHLAIVVDEYGGMAGIVTIEDLIEEIVGEIQDEYDAEEPRVAQSGEGDYLVEARIPLDDVNRLLNAALPTEESDTLGGFIYTSLGKVPAVGDRVEFEGLSFTVESVLGRGIRKVRIRRQAPAAPAPGREAGPSARVQDSGEAIQDPAASTGQPGKERKRT